MPRSVFIVILVCIIFNISKKINAECCKKFFNETIEKLGIPSIFKTNQDSQYEGKCKLKNLKY